MKIRLTYTEAEAKKAAAIVQMLKAVLPVKVKESPVDTNGYSHTYLATIKPPENKAQIR